MTNQPNTTTRPVRSNRISVSELLNRYHTELSQAAAAVGVDWHKVQPQINGFPFKLTRGIELERPYRGKVAVFGHLFQAKNGDQYPIIRFYTNKHGGYQEIVNTRQLFWEEYQHQQNGFINPPAVDFKPSTTVNTQKSDSEQWNTARFEQFNRSFQTLVPATNSGYFAAKGLAITEDLQQSLNLRQGVDKQRGSFVAFPIAKGGQVIGYQQLFDTAFTVNDEPRNKNFIGKTGGGFAVIGQPDRSKTLMFTEGLATAISCHQATGAAVIVCLDAMNLIKICKAFKAAGFNKGLIAADNDIGKAHGNTGVFAALRAAFSTGFKIAVPELDNTASDFDDLRIASGLEAVKQQLKAAKNRLAVPKSRTKFYKLLAQFSPVNQTVKYLKAAAMAAARDCVTLADIGKQAIELNQQAQSHGFKTEVFDALTLMEHLDAKLESRIRHENALVDLTGVQVFDVQKTPFATLQDRMLKDGGIWLDNRAMGAGKTKNMRELAQRIDCLPFEQRQLTYIAHRVALIKTAATRLNFSFYEDIAFWVNEQPKSIAICVNSILKHHIQQRYGVVFIDEIRQTLEHILNGTCDNRLGVYNALIATINNAFLVVGADADLNQATLEWLNANTRHKIHLLTDSQPVDAAQITELATADAVILAAEETIKTGQRVWFATDSTEQAKKAAKFLSENNPDAKVLLLTRENKLDSQQAAFLADPDGESQHYQAIIHSPVISSGVSITNGAFSKVFATFQNVIPPNEMLQTIGRVRGASEIVLSFKDRHRTDRTANGQLLIDGETIKRARFLNGEALKLTDFDKRRIAAQATTNAALNDYRRYFLKLAMMRGFRFQTADEAEKINIDGLGSAVRVEIAAAVLDARIIESNEANKLKKANATTQADSDALTRYQVANITGKAPEDLTAEDIEHYDGGRLVDIVRNREVLADDLVKLKIEDTANHLSRDKLKSKASVQYLGKSVLQQLDGQELTVKDAAAICVWLQEHAGEIAVNGLGNFAKASTIPIKTLNRFLSKFGFEVIEFKRDRYGTENRRQLYRLVENQYISECVARRAANIQAFENADVIDWAKAMV